MTGAVESARLVAMRAWLTGFRLPWKDEDSMTEAEAFARMRATLERADDLVAAEAATLAEFAAMVLVETRDGFRAVPEPLLARLRALTARIAAAGDDQAVAIAGLAAELLTSRNARGEVPDALVKRLRRLAGLIA